MKKKYHGIHYWDNNFENHFFIPPTKESLESEIQHSEGLTWVRRTVIMDGDGEVLYDVEKESSNVPEATKSTGTKKKKAVRKATRTKSNK